MIIGSDEFIDKMCELIEDLTPIPDMAVLLDVTEYELRTLISTPNHKVAKAFKLKSAEVARVIRHRNIELAAVASPSAVTAVAQHLHEFEESL